MKYLIILLFILIGFYRPHYNRYKQELSMINDTIITKKDIKVFYKKKGKNVDSIHVFDKKFILKERGYIKGNVVKFYNLNHEMVSIGKFYNGNYQGNFFFFRNKKLYKTEQYKNGKVDGISIVFTKDSKIEVISEYTQDSISGFSLVFDNDYPKYLRTGSFADSLAVIGTFKKNGSVESLSLPNSLDDYLESALRDTINK